jgi:hypothetical protein
MPILQGTVSSFKAELPQAIHNLLTDTIKIALYTANADLGPATTVYTTSNEVSGTGYTAGGATLTGGAITLDGAVACITFANVSWPGSAFTARGALIYNASKANRAIAVLDFGSDKRSATFTITFPVSTATTAVLRIS